MPILVAQHCLQSIYFAFIQICIYFYFLKITDRNKTMELVIYNLQYLYNFQKIDYLLNRIYDQQYQIVYFVAENDAWKMAII